MLPVPVLDLETLGQVAGDPLAQECLAGGVQARLLAQRAHEDLQAFTERVVAEVVKAGLGDRGVHQVSVR
jgi:hypothetical protein